MHTVIADECTGCDLCVEPCPVDCIDMLPVEETIADWRWSIPAQPGQPGQVIATDKRGELNNQLDNQSIDEDAA
jgi:electron transport complex protein RnfB